MFVKQATIKYKSHYKRRKGFNWLDPEAESRNDAYKSCRINLQKSRTINTHTIGDNIHLSAPITAIVVQQIVDIYSSVSSTATMV